MNRNSSQKLDAAKEHCVVEDYEKALAILDDLILQDPELGDALYERAKIYSRIKKYQLALRDFTQLILMEAGNAHYYSERAVAFLLCGKPQESLNDLDMAVRLEPKNPFRYSSRAFVKDRIGDLMGSLSDYNMAVELDPEDAIAYNNKGLVEEKLGLKEQASQSFAKADKMEDKARKIEIDKSTKKELAVNIEPIQKPSAANGIAKDAKKAPLKPSFLDYLKVIKNTISTREGWSEFLSFMKTKMGKP
jgi:tetratricopeptide (TPR) repeat protein